MCRHLFITARRRELDLLTLCVETVQTIYLFGTADKGTPYTDSGFKRLWNRLMYSYVDLLISQTN